MLDLEDSASPRHALSQSLQGCAAQRTSPSRATSPTIPRATVFNEIVAVVRQMGLTKLQSAQPRSS